MSKAKKLIVILFVFSLLLVENTFARMTTLWRASDTTFVSSDHPDDFFADVYRGIASVRGRGRGISSDGRNIYYTWTRITYDVQGIKNLKLQDLVESMIQTKLSNV